MAGRRAWRRWAGTGAGTFKFRDAAAEAFESMRAGTFKGTACPVAVKSCSDGKVADKRAFAREHQLAREHYYDPGALLWLIRIFHANSIWPPAHAPARVPATRYALVATPRSGPCR